MEAAAREQEMEELSAKAGGVMPFISRRAIVSPFRAEVKQALTSLIKTIANRPGIDGVVWRETDPAGYDLPISPALQDSRRELGYTETARLAFLRQEHADPVDIYPQRIIGTVDTVLPTLDFSRNGNGLQEKWRVFRASANLALMKSLYAAVPAALTGADMPRLFVKQRRSGYLLDWYGTWDNSDLPIPTHHRMSEDAKDDQSSSTNPSPVTQANAQSKTALIRLTLPTGKTLQAGALAAQIQKWVTGTPWKGFVVDLTAPVKL